MAVHLVVAFVIIALYFIYFTLVRNQNYWKIRNVPFVKPLPLFGNYKDLFLFKRHIFQIDQELCQRFPNEPYVGSFYGTKPALIIQDPNLLKLIMSKEFYFFSGREISDYADREMLARNMFAVGGDEWKTLRMNLTPLFSSAKLKNMFHLIKNSADALESLLAEELKKSPNIEIRDILSRYTIECITSCAFGLSSGTMKSYTDNSRNPFKTVGEQIFDTSEFRALKNICRTMWPGLFYAFGFKLLDDDVSTFFNNIISGVLKEREKTKSSRNDFVDLILAWKKENYISGDCLSNAKTGDKKRFNIEVNDELLVAQCVLFFGAGFETTSTSISYLMYELAKNKIAQEKVIKEVDEYFANNEEYKFECINCMPYTEACIEESLRLYPVLGILFREVMHDFTLPTGLSMKRGDRIHIPVYPIQHNPDHFPEPEEFRPERFFGEEKKNIKPFTYMPFGEGPRTCMGNFQFFFVNSCSI